MTEDQPFEPLSIREFVPLMALIVSLGALSIDAMLPAIGPIASSLGASDAQDGQLIVSSMFLGFAFGQLIYGPLSDGIGRKRAIYLGTAFFLIGCGLSVSAQTFELMIAGRLLQGFGAAATRIVTMALVRDQYVGEKMARVMSLIMGVFVLVPAVAPALGQGVLMVSHWRAIFVLLAAQSAISVTWLALRQPETHPRSRRRDLSGGSLLADVREVFRHRETVGYTLASALVFANLVGYLTVAPQLFAELYDVVEGFPVYFAMTAGAIGCGSFLNSRWVEHYGARRVCLAVLSLMASWSCAFFILVWILGGRPDLWQLMVYLVGAFFCMGPLMGNLNSLAMQPVGHVAGTASAAVGSLSTFISLFFGSALGRAYAGDVYPLVGGFLVLGLSALVVTSRSEKGVALA